MKPFKLRTKTNKEGIPFWVPETWEELSTGSFEDLKASIMKAPLQSNDLLAGISGIERKFWEQTSLDNAAPILQVIQGFWNNENVEAPDFMNLPVPSSIEIKGKQIKINKAPGSYLLAQVEAMNQKFKAWADADKVKKGTLDELLPYSSEIIAIFVQPGFHDGDFDEEKSKELIPEIRKLPAVKGIPLACFFLSKSLNLLQIGLRASTPPRKKMQLLKRLGLRT